MQNAQVGRASMSKGIRKDCYREYQRALQSNLLIPGPCEECGQEPAQGHHSDYKHPLEVRWLCPSHHQRLHRILLGYPPAADTGNPALALRTIRIAFNDAELLILKKQANLEGVTMTAFIRQLVIKNTVPGKTPEDAPEARASRMPVHCPLCGRFTSTWTACGACGGVYCQGCASVPDETGNDCPDPGCNLHPCVVGGGR